MFDSEERKYLADMEERLLAESAQNMRVIIDKKLNLILEALQTQQSQMKDFASNSRIDALEEEVLMLRSVVMKHGQELKELKHA